MSQTVERALPILRSVSGGPRALADAPEHLAVRKSTAPRLMRTLKKEDTVRRLHGRYYVVGFGIVPLAPIIDQRVIYLDKIDGDSTVAMGSRIGLSEELHTAAVAKIPLSRLGDLQISQLLNWHDFLRHTRTTITSRGAFQVDLQATRKRGWAEDLGEKENYISCLALLLFDATSRVPRGISATAPRLAAPLEELRELIPLVSETAIKISRELSWKGDVRGFE